MKKILRGAVLIIDLSVFVLLIYSYYLMKEDAKLIKKLRTENNTLLESCTSSPLQEREKGRYK